MCENEITSNLSNSPKSSNSSTVFYSLVYLAKLEIAMAHIAVPE